MIDKIRFHCTSQYFHNKMSINQLMLVKFMYMIKILCQFQLMISDFIKNIYDLFNSIRFHYITQVLFIM